LAAPPSSPTRRSSDLFIQIRHEETGALAASAYSKLTGRIGVCLSIAGPGAIHLQNGLYDAKKDKTSMLAIVGQVTSTSVGTDVLDRRSTRLNSSHVKI